MPQYVLLNPITVVSPTGVVTHRAGDTLSTRPSPLSDDAKTARAPLPPEQLVAARNDRVHVEKGKLIKATPIMKHNSHPVAVGEYVLQYTERRRHVVRVTRITGEDNLGVWFDAVTADGVVFNMLRDGPYGTRKRATPEDILAYAVAQAQQGAGQ